MMHKGLLTAILCVPMFSAPAFGTTITTIYGDGNTDEGWTANTSPSLVGDIQLALRAKNRAGGIVEPTGSTYSFATAPATRGLWNYDFSINSDVADGSVKLTAYDYYLSVDGDSSQGVLFFTVDPLNHWIDNEYGTAATGNGDGLEGLYSVYAADNNIAQNSQNITFGDYPAGAMLLEQNATYSFELYAVADGAGPNGDRLAEVAMTVVVGSGGAAVPDAGATAALLGLGIAGIAGLGMRKRA